MRNFFLLLIAATIAANTSAQSLSTGAGDGLVLFPAAELYFSGQTLTPSTPLALSNNTITRDTVPAHPFARAYLARTYRYSNPPVFSGTIRTDYREGELNGLSEPDLQLMVYNGAGWQLAGATLVNSADNYVVTTGLSGQNLGELILSQGGPLPLLWGDVWATRRDAAVLVQWTTMQEVNIDHFDVERSTDGINWMTAAAGIIAANKPGRSDHQVIDQPNYLATLYYRIRQTGMDGRASFSRIVAVAGTSEAEKLSLSPNPATDHFMIAGSAASEIKQVDLISATGAVIVSWPGQRSLFKLTNVPGGIYQLRIRMNNHELLNRRLMVK